MNKVTEGLISALGALPKEEKKEAISMLLNDKEFRVFIFNTLSEKLSVSQQNAPRVEKDIITRTLNRREIGRQQREKYINQLKRKGITIDLQKNIWCKTPSGLSVAIPFANEKRLDRWFLGIGELDLLNKKKSGKIVIILLCQSKNGELMDFIIPPSQVEELIPYLSRSQKGQYKINLKRDGLRYQLLTPNEKPKDVSDYRSNISLLE